MTEYFLLKTAATTLFEPTDLNYKLYQHIMTKEHFAKIPEDQICYYKYSDEVEMPDVMLRPTFMVGRSIYNIVKLYDENIEWKSLQVFPDTLEYAREMVKSYWIPCLPEYKCLHEETIVLPNGTVDRLVLNRRKMRNVDIFRVADARIKENLVAVSLPLAESINRRNVYGVSMERVEVK